MALGTDAPRYAVIASNAYSGSTLLSALLGAHPQIATVSDVSGTRRRDQMDRFLCSCGRRMRDCPFWTAVQVAAARHGIDDLDLGDFALGFDGGGSRRLASLRVRSLGSGLLEAARDAAFHLVPGTVPLLERVGARSAAFARAVLEVTGREVFVDASKERMRVRYLARHLPGDLRVIHLVRDVRGVVESTVRRGKLALSTREAAERWARTNAAILRSAAALPEERRMLVRYEELCRDPERALAEMAAFLGVDPARAPLDTPQHLLGNRVRLGSLRDVSLDERWRDALPEDEQRRIVDAAGSVYRALYPSGSSTPTASAGHV